MRKRLLFLLGCLSLALLQMNAENTFTRLNNSVAQPMGMSPDGRYVVGIHNELPFQSYLWDTQTPDLDWKTEQTETDYDKTGYFTAVNNQGIIVGAFKDKNYIINVEDEDQYGRPVILTGPITVAAIWKEGECTSLGIGVELEGSGIMSFDDGTRATCISEDGNTIGGNIYINQTAKQLPCVWRYMNGEWKFEAYNYPEDAFNTVITDMSADGSIIVGYADYQTYTVPLLWRGANNMTIIDPYFYFEGVEWSGRCYSISPNGQFIGMTLGKRYERNPAGVYDIEMNWFTSINDFGDYPSGMEITSVSDTGDLFGTYSYVGGDRRNFFYSNEHSGEETFDLGYYFYFFASELEVPSAAFNGNLVAASADGKILLGYTGGFSWFSNVEYPNPSVFPPYPPGEFSARLTDLREVTLTWNASAALGYNLKEYIIYRNGQHYQTISYEESEEVITFVDREVPVGTVQYAISVLGEYDPPPFGDHSRKGELIESQKTKQIKVIVAPDMDLPFADGFDYGTPESNYWNKEVQQLGTYEYLWGYVWTLGTINSSQVLNIAVDGYTDYSQSLTTKHLDARGVNEVYISYAIAGLQANVPEEGWDLSGDTLSVEVSVDGTQWIPVRKHSIDEEPYFWDTEIHDISALVAGKIFQVRLRVHGKNLAHVVWQLDMFRVGARDELRKAPLEGKAIVREDRVDLMWTNDVDSYELTYLDNIYGYAMTRVMGSDQGHTIYVNLFDKEDLRPYHGSYLTSLNAYIHGAPDIIDELILLVYEDDKIIREQVITDYFEFDMNLFVLDEPVLIDANKSIKYGFKMVHEPGEYPVFYQNTFSYVRGKSDLYSEDDGETWQKLSEYYEKNPDPTEPDPELAKNIGYACWFMSANVTKQNTIAFADRNLDIISYNLYRNGERINDELLCYLQPKFVDDQIVENAVYEVTAFYPDGSVSGATRLEYATDPVNGIGKAVTNEDLISIYPNPAYDVVYVQGEFDKVQIVNISGQVVHETIQNSIKVHHLEEGVYFIHLEKAGNSFTRKLIVKK